MDAWLSFWVSTVLAIVSIGLNLWQHHVYSNRIERLCGSLTAWWHWARAMRITIDRYWDFAGRNKGDASAIHAVATGTINGLAEGTGGLAGDIQKTCIALGFPDPYHKPRDRHAPDAIHQAAQTGV